MRFKIHDDDFDVYEATFENDYLDRIPVSQHLTQLVDRIQDPLVIALDGPWGSGKSYFLKRWTGAHKNQNGGRAKVIYFDAFAHDYLSDPLTSLVAELANRSLPQEEGTMDKVKKFTYLLARPVARIALAVATAGASEAVGNVADAGLDAFKEVSNEKLEKFWEQETGRHDAMVEFRNSINELVTCNDGTRTPLVIVIDELDRCRPDYSLEVLEVIKHLFNVENVHFVLGANFTSLENSVKARYGQEIDACRYLQKFISFSLRLPDQFHGSSERTILRYAQRMCIQHGINNDITTEISHQVRLISKNNEISFRDINKICATISILPEGYMGNNDTILNKIIFTTMIIIQTINPALYRKLITLNLTSDELIFMLGVDKEKLEATLDNKQPNPQYDHAMTYLFTAWEWIRSNGVAPPYMSPHSVFGIHGFSDAIRRIPQQISEQLMKIRA